MNKKDTKQEEKKDVNQIKKEKFEKALDKVKDISKAIKLHTDVKKAVEKEEVDYNYLRYIENSLEDKIFGDMDLQGIMPKLLLEIVCPNLIDVENFDYNKLQIETIGSHFEEQENYIDKICVYDNKLVSVFGISEMHPNKFINYEPRKFSRVDMLQAIAAKYKQGQRITLFQYDEYYICIEENQIKAFSERKITALVKVQETIFDKIKEKLSNLFTFKKKTYPDLQLVYDSNPNRLKEFEHKSKLDAKNRMKALLNRERELVRE